MNTRKISIIAFLLLWLFLLLAAGLPLRRWKADRQTPTEPGTVKQLGADERSAEEPFVLSLLPFFP